MLNTALRVLARAYLDICLLRRRPQDLPCSTALMILTLSAYALVSLTMAAIDLATEQALLVALADTALLCLGAALVLYLVRKPARTIQTVTALAGTGTVLGLIALPIVRWLTASHASQGDASVPALLWLGLFFWSLAVTGHVLRHALDIRFAAGLLMAAIFMLANVQIVQWLLPAAG
jgi:hypothetical protein